MPSPSFTGQFKRDVKLAEKRGKDLSNLRVVIESHRLQAGRFQPRFCESPIRPIPLQAQSRGQTDA